MKLEDIFTFENIYNAHKECRKAKQHKGEVIRFEISLGINILKIMTEMKNKKYKMGQYKKFEIYEPKKRIIEAPSYKDRVIIRCLCDNLIRPKIEKSLIYDNVACRKNKGTDFGINRLKSFLRREYIKTQNNKIYYLKCDIKKYFPSINHNILLNQLEKIGFERDVMWLLEKLVREQPDNVSLGLPLGNQTSQWFALLYLNSVDRLIKEQLRIKSYVRYMDDFILLHSNKSNLQTCLQKIKELCKKELALELNDKTMIGKVANGIDFLGYRFFLTKSGKIITKLRGSAKLRLKRNLKVLNKLEAKGKVNYSYVYARKNAYYTHIKDTNESKELKGKVNPKSKKHKMKS